MSNPGHAMTFTKGDDGKGIPKKPILPTPQEVAMLRRIAMGYAVLTFTDDGPHYAYNDGAALPLRRSPKDPDGKGQFERMVSNGWLIPDKKDSLFEDASAQVYRVRKP